MKKRTHQLKTQYKKLNQVLRAEYDKVVVHSDELTSDTIQNYDVIFIVNPKVDFSLEEIECLSAFPDNEKSIAFFGSGRDHGDKIPQLINLDTFLLERGIEFENTLLLGRHFSNTYIQSMSSLMMEHYIRHFNQVQLQMWMKLILHTGLVWMGIVLTRKKKG